MSNLHSFLKCKGVALLFMVFIGHSAFAQVTSFTSVGNAETTVLEQVLSLDNVAALSFGSIFPISTAETVTLLPSNNNNPNAAPSISKSNANVLVTDSPSAGIWDITGVPGALVTVTLPTDGTVFLEDTAGHSMPVNAFVLRSYEGSSLNLTLAGAGTARFAVFATLSLAPNQTAGGYTGTYPVTVNYQ